MCGGLREVVHVYFYIDFQSFVVLLEMMDVRFLTVDQSSWRVVEELEQ